ncbi:MAG: PLP-dependent aminotransferase family protein [Deltaproteobacteria bacterium]|nr:MAG: PLP-dependent aminotransferase family protein [Deltaproteobacteria bacterium]
MSHPERTINFTRGVPADEAFPAPELAECVAAVLRERKVQVLQYGPSTGFLPLREWLAARHGVAVEQVLLGNGSLPFIDLLGWTLLERGDTVLVESPTYDRTLTLLRRHGARIAGVPITADGLDLEALETAVRRARPRLLYTIPDSQNPSGATATLATRRRVAELAAEHGFWILEDAPYRPLRYRGAEVVSLRELIPARTLHMSSFTKQISPGVRVGYLIGDARLVARLAKAAEDTYITPNLLGEAAVYEFCRRGLLEPQLERLRALYRPRLEAACASMRSCLADAAWIEPEGGFFLSLTLSAGFWAEDLCARATAARLNLSDGRGFFPEPANGERFLRLPFCALTPEEIAEGIQRLAEVVAHVARRV